MGPQIPFDANQSAAILERTPATLMRLLEGIGPDWTGGDDDPEDWSPHAVLGHLVHGELTDWIPRTRIILDHGTAAPFEPFDREGMFAGPGETTAERLARFASLRQQNLVTLRELNLTATDLDRRGMHPGLGEITLRQMLATWTAHDLTHIAQIAVAMARRYTAEIGPWIEYFPDLQGG